MAHGKVSIREPKLKLPVRAVEEVTSCLLGQIESVIAGVKTTLKGQIFPSGQDRALAF